MSMSATLRAKRSAGSRLSSADAKARGKVFHVIAFWAFLVVSIIYLVPLLLVLVNSFKGNLFVSQTPFALPNSESFTAGQNYTDGLQKTGFFQALGVSVFITVCATLVIVLLTAMVAWYIARVKAWYTSVLYYLFVFSMVVPFQMVMFTMSKVANVTHLDNPIGMIVLYTGFGAGLSVFIYVGFIRSIPIDLEEAAMIDGASSWQVFFRVIFPILRPTAMTIAILNVMWIWNDFLLPYLVIGSQWKTIPVAVQSYMQGTYGAKDMGGFMAMLVLSIIPIIIFFLIGQKSIIKGVTAGAVKG
ncbi:MAG: carbohydrate ABC transporter permease [Propionibacteriaceae bacterium]|jgi:raffinose/stachyose/melibiose transport system permease protein|nr:carbohydrate ABC transporter permease [Propionibacteriaceae bacterium]